MRFFPPQGSVDRRITAVLASSCLSEITEAQECLKSIEAPCEAAEATSKSAKIRQSEISTSLWGRPLRKSSRSCLAIPAAVSDAR